MLRKVLWMLPAGLLATVAAAAPAAPPALTVGQIIERNIAARGGAENWKKVQTVAWTGHVETGPDGISKAPFVMMFRRPDSTRFEILTEGQRSVRIFDGHKGWKLRPASNGAPDVKEYNPEELSYARDAAGLDGPLFDYQAKGVSVVLAGIDSVEGHQAYRLGLTMPSGQTRSDWIDAQSFLELKYERATRNATGQSGSVSVYYRNYQTVQGLVMPFMIETGGAADKDTDKMVIEKIALNPALEASLFAKPAVPGARHKGVVVDTTAAR